MLFWGKDKNKKKQMIYTILKDNRTKFEINMLNKYIIDI